MKLPLTMNDNLYSIPPATFELLAECVNTLCEFPEIELAEVANREHYAPGCSITVYSEEFEHRIEIDGTSGLVGLSMTKLDCPTPSSKFSGPADEAKSWLQIQCLILTAEGYPDAVETLRARGFEI